MVWGENLRQLHSCLASPGYPRASQRAWDAQTHSREDGLEEEIPAAVRGPDKHARRSFCNGSPHCHHKSLTLALDKKNGAAEDCGTHKVLQNAPIMLAVTPEIGRLRGLLHFAGQILTLALPHDPGCRVFRQNHA